MLTQKVLSIGLFLALAAAELIVEEDYLTIDLKGVAWGSINKKIMFIVCIESHDHFFFQNFFSRNFYSFPAPVFSMILYRMWSRKFKAIKDVKFQ